MSKQNVGKGNPAMQSQNKPKGVPNQTAARTAGSAPPRNNTTTAAKNAARQGGSRSAALPVKKKSGFRLRPLDIALVVAFALVVGFIIMSGLQAPPVQVDANATVPADAKHLPAGAAAPNFSLLGEDGKTYSLADQKGKVAVLEFMATWCPHCQDDAPMMNQLDAAYKDKGVQVFGINATPYGHDHASPAKMDDLKWFKTNYAVTFPLLIDQHLQSARDYGVLSYPTIYIIDQQGNVSMPPSETAIPTYDELAAAIDKLLPKQ